MLNPASMGMVIAKINDQLEAHGFDGAVALFKLKLDFLRINIGEDPANNKLNDLYDRLVKSDIHAEKDSDQGMLKIPQFYKQYQQNEAFCDFMNNFLGTAPGASPEPSGQ